MKKPRALATKDREISDFDRGKRTPPRQVEFLYELDGQRFTLQAPAPVVAAAERAYARVVLSEATA